MKISLNTKVMVRSGVRGVIAAMAMSGLRQATTSLNLVESSPPKSVLQKTVPGLLEQLPGEQHPALLAVAHWGYGLGAGLAFGALPERLRHKTWVGPVYGMALLAAFHFGIAPALRIEQRLTDVHEQLALTADHLLYGIVVAGFPMPHRD
ncbi:MULTISPECIES: hypothetical protein [Micromonospora]|uniref:DUF1440 domain-containing protein n=1 Tax=Micromonospora solifontis TaxID=2487138 RepID=A0ABX9WE40_9ACTN|nr:MULTISPECIES: hypothetical protein [Micromonospora]NES12815.1 DUF1440 domain-containing protein [Micromonospora sp. PPF5-17B]NES38921.1 DUF1440 domain-containing protein [Micromonospora solifontis]NES54740.1 DUF1440 domain-containing protein [Micromonospora sp. PPF5-6]RNL92582.1 hypothetical protein EFE23_22690 [Micromonospora solifontis]